MEEPQFQLPNDLWAPTRPTSPSATDPEPSHQHLQHLPPSLTPSSGSSPSSASPASLSAANIASSRAYPPSAALAQLEPKRSYNGFFLSGQQQHPSSSASTARMSSSSPSRHAAGTAPTNGGDPAGGTPHSPSARPPVHRSPSSSRNLPEPIGSPSHRPLGGSALSNQPPPQQQQRAAHSPPQAPPGASRSRSQSFASGFRPGGLPSFSFTSTGPAAAGGVFDDDDDEDEGGRGRDDGKGNNSPFTRDLREILQDTTAFHQPPRRPSASQHPSSSRFDEFGFGRGGPVPASASSSSTAGGYGGMGINLFHAIESSGRFALESANVGAGGGGYGGPAQGGSAGLNSGTGSRRHSVSIVPGGKNGGAGGAVPDFRVSGAGSFGGGRNPWGNSGLSRGGGGGGGFSDEDLATSLGNALNLNVHGDDRSASGGGGGHFHVPSSSMTLNHPSSLPIYAPSPPRSFPSFVPTLGADQGLSPISQHGSYLSTSAAAPRGGGSVERDYRTPPSGSAAGHGFERPGSKSRSASFADFTRPDHSRWITSPAATGGSGGGGGEDDDDFASSPRGRERSFGLAPGGGGGAREASSPRGRIESLAPASRVGLDRSASRDPIASSILRSPPGPATTTTTGFAPPPATHDDGGGGGYPSFRPQQQQQHDGARFNAFAPAAPPFVPSGGSSQSKGSPFGGLPMPIGPPGGGAFDMPFGGQQGAGRGYGGPPPPGSFNPHLDTRFAQPPQQQQQHQQHQQRPPHQQHQQQQQQFPNFYPQPPQYNLAHHQRQLALDSPPPVAGPSLADLGKGLPLHAVPSSTPLYIIEFKAGRTDLFYSPDRSLGLAKGDLVIVEADRGKDLGKIVNDSISIDEVKRFQERQTELALIAQQAGLGNQGGGAGAASAAAGAEAGGAPVGVPNSVTVRGLTKEIMPKRIYSKAQPLDAHLLVTKMQDEAKALVLCQQKVKQKNLPMEVVDAEFQWDRRKLTFYFIAERRIDFRELVRELFRYHKTRIWMACLGGISSTDDSAQQQQQ